MISRRSYYLRMLLLHAWVVSRFALGVAFNRREALSAMAASTVSATNVFTAYISNAAEIENEEEMFAYKKRNRKRNKDAMIREDYWYMSGSQPPRKLEGLQADFDNPKWNAWGTCTESAAGISCTYVSLNQRVPAYSKYAFNVRLGIKEFGELGQELESGGWNKAIELLEDTPTGMPGPICDSLLKAILLATGLLASPNYSGPPKELLVARFYVNEVGFSIGELKAAIAAKDSKRAKAAWQFGCDSWNSYVTIVNRSIVPKVGDKFELI